MICHIGLPKSGTTSLQTIFFRNLGNAGAVTLPSATTHEKIKAHCFTNLPTNEIISLGKELLGVDLISFDRLLHWQPNYWEESIKKIKDIVPEKTKILITVRHPDEYLTSLYLQHLMSGGTKSINDFFINQKLYDWIKPQIRPGSWDVINLEQFDLAKLSKMFNDDHYFSQIVFLPTERLQNENFWSEYLPAFSSSAFDKFKKSHNINRQYSKTATYLTHIRSMLYSKFGARPIILGESGFDIENPIQAFKNFNPYEEQLSSPKTSQIVYDTKFSSLPTFEKFYQFVPYLLKRAKALKSWRSTMQGIVDKIIPYQRPEIDIEKIRYNIHRNSNIKFYNEIIENFDKYYE